MSLKLIDLNAYAILLSAPPYFITFLQPNEHFKILILSSYQNIFWVKKNFQIFKLLLMMIMSAF